MRKRSIAALIGATIGVGLAGIAGAGYSQFKKMIERPEVPPKRKESVEQAVARSNMVAELRKRVDQCCEIVADDQVILRGLLFRTKKDNKKVIISFHGYQSSGLAGMGKYAPMYEKAGYDYLLISQRGHDLSDGKYITFGVKEQYDGLAWVKYIIQEYGEDVEIVLHGVSMGAATIMLMAGNPQLPPQVKAIIEDCGFDDMENQNHSFFKEISEPIRSMLIESAHQWAKVLADYDYHLSKPIEAVKKASIPCLMIHGTDDQVVPYWMMLNLQNAYQGPCESFTVEHGAHARCFDKDPDAYQEAVFSFLKEYHL